MQSEVLESLVATDADTLETIPLLAESWEIVDNGDAWQAWIDANLTDGETVDTLVQRDDAPPGMQIVFTLRRGLNFSDGEPLTSEDVVYSLELLQDERINAPSQRAFYENIRSAEALDGRTVRFDFRKPHYEALGHAGGRPVLPKHFYERFTPDAINSRPGLLLGSGPYRMPDPENWTPGQQVELVRNARYWGVQPATEKRVWREITNNVARVTAFRNGEIDLLSAQPDEYKTLIDDPALMSEKTAYAYDAIPSGYRFIAWNQERGGEPTKFADKRVRQAMTLLTPRQQVVDDLYAGLATVANGPFPPGSPQQDPSLPTRAQDVDAALALLEEAGWADRDGDGVLEDAAGEAFEVGLIYGSGNDLVDRLVLYLKDAYARAGIVLRPDPMEFAVLIERLDDQQFDAIMLAWGGGAVERDIRQIFHSVQAKAGGDNFMSYRNPELDRIIDAAHRELDDDARMELWQAAHRIVWEDQPYTFLNFGKSLRLIDDRFENVLEVRSGLNDPDAWYVPAPDQVWTE